LAEAVILAYTEDRKDSNFDQTTKYSEVADGFSVSTEANAGSVPQITQSLHISKYYTSHKHSVLYSLSHCVIKYTM